MDGVPNLTQKPIRPARAYLRVHAADAGTFSGITRTPTRCNSLSRACRRMIIEEREPVPVDRDLFG